VSVWQIILIVGGTTVGAVGLMLYVWRADWPFLRMDPDRAGGVFSFIGTGFAVLLAFIVFVAFNSYNDAEKGAASEGQAVFEASTSLDAFPAHGLHDDLEGALICYGRAVSHREWATMPHGRFSPTVSYWDWFLRDRTLALDVGRYPTQVAAISQLLSEHDNRADGRRMRMAEASPAVTWPVWFLLIVGAVITLTAVLLFKERKESAIVQGGMMGMIAAVVSAGLVLVWVLDHPYTGDTGSIEPTEIQRAIGTIQAEHPKVVPACSPQGAPTKRLPPAELPPELRSRRG
jgi:hypothetical protein